MFWPKAQELESNNLRAQFANRYYGVKNENKNQGNDLRFNAIKQSWPRIGIFGKTIIRIPIKNKNCRVNGR